MSRHALAAKCPTEFSPVPARPLQNGLAYIFTVTASDKQWAASEGTLRTMLGSFRA